MKKTKLWTFVPPGGQFIQETKLFSFPYSYVSRISQQVFVDPKHAKSYDIKSKFASFFSSVSVSSKAKYKTNNTKL